MKCRIEKIRALQVLDSRGTPTVRAQVMLTDGSCGWAIAPSGASTGSHEAHEKRDGAASWRGRGVRGAVESVNGPIAKTLTGMDALCQRRLDEAMVKLDGTGEKSMLGANAILAVSLACARAAARAVDLPLYRYLGGINGMAMPVPMMNILNGGRHAGNNLDIQEFMIRPVGAHSFAQAVEMGAAVYAALKEILSGRKLNTSLGDEGGFAPNLENEREALDLMVDAVEKAGLTPGKDVSLALDAAASEWAQEDGSYLMPKIGLKMSRADVIDLFAALCRDYPIDSLEDPLGEEDFEGFGQLRQRLPAVQIVGDDLFTTNVQRLKKGMAMSCATAVLIKPNQIGTLTETLECIGAAQSGGWQCVISHRSGETEDPFIADLAVAVNAGQIKCGAPARTDRTCKYNRLLQIESEMI